MAGDWIKLESVTPDKPEVHAMAELLGIDPDAVLGKLVRVWIWADQQTENGDAPSVTRTLLDRVTCSPGFTDALLSVSWLTEKAGAFSFTNFDRHNGKPAKTRALTKNRMQKSRDVNSVTIASLEKRREEVNNPIVPLNDKTTKPKSRVGYSDDFEKFWFAYPSQGRTDKPGAFKSWGKALECLQRNDSATFLIRRATDFARSPKATKPDAEGKTYVKHAATWLNKACWDDTPEAWGISRTSCDRPELQRFEGRRAQP